MALLSVNSSFGLRVLTERDGNLAEMPRYARLQEKHSFGFILRQHVHLAVSPSPPPPPPGTPYHLRFVRGTLTKGFSTTGLAQL